jgi:hypothetical protein
MDKVQKLNSNESILHIYKFRGNVGADHLVDASTDLRVMQVDLYKQGRSIEPSGS